VAFDGEYSRLGHGKGYYDEFLAHYTTAMLSDRTTSVLPTLVGLALREQIVDAGAIPMSDRDWRVHVLATADGFYHSKAALLHEEKPPNEKEQL